MTHWLFFLIEAALTLRDFIETFGYGNAILVYAAGIYLWKAVSLPYVFSLSFAHVVALDELYEERMRVPT